MLQHNSLTLKYRGSYLTRRRGCAFFRDHDLFILTQNQSAYDYLC